jgi:HAD superfamily hydrolase (TIGR01509 family)
VKSMFESLPYQAALFDMDGVVIDTHRAVTDFWLKLAADHNVTLSDDDFTRHIYGVPGTHTLDVLFPMIDKSHEALLQRMVDYEDNQTYTPINGVLAFLSALKQHNIPSALVTSGRRSKVTQVYNQLPLADLFSGEITASDIQHGKPNPEPYLKGAQLLGIAPERCIVFEDAISGVQAGVAAGALVVGIGNDMLRDVGASYVIPDFSAVTLTPTNNGTLELRLSSDYQLLLAHA